MNNRGGQAVSIISNNFGVSILVVVSNLLLLIPFDQYALMVA